VDKTAAGDLIFRAQNPHQRNKRSCRWAGPPAPSGYNGTLITGLAPLSFAADDDHATGARLRHIRRDSGHTRRSGIYVTPPSR